MLPDEMKPPKTRFNSRDRSKEATSSPRLKSFPAEKIKKLDNQPMFSPEPNDALIVQDPRETGTYFASSSIRSNNDHGDALPAKLSSHQQSKDTSDTDQQQVIANHQQICQTNPHSENLLIRPIASPERHPFVSSMLQGTVVCDRSLRNPSAIINQPVIMQTPTQVAMSQTQQSSSNSREIIDQNRNETFALVNGCERQSIGGRNAINHKQIFIQPKQAAIVQDANAPLSDRCANNCQNVYHAQLHNAFQQNPQQINEQTQHNAYHQQMLPQALNQMQPPILDQRQHLHDNSDTFYGHYNQQLSATQVSGHGMTSPQDMTVSQMRLLQHNLPIHNQNLGYPVNLQSAWPQKDRWIQTINQQHLHQQSPQQWPYYHQDTNFIQKDSRTQGQFNTPQNHKSTNRQSVAETYNQQNDGKKKLQFTPDMIRDQELLVSTMRQQGIPDEVMRRQFEALLNEQQKHLVYLAQFQQQEDIPDIKRIRLTQRRIEKEEKPEWMVHITPPRISYNEIERMKTQPRDQKKQYLTDSQLPEEVNRTVTARQHDYCQQKKQEINDQAILPQQMYVQMNPHQLWQQQMITWPYKNDRKISCGYTAYYPYGHQQNTLNNAYHQANPTFNKYIPHNMRYNPYYPHSEQQKIWHKEHNPSSLNSIDNQILSMDPARFEQNKRPTEPSSLLKMRMYKEVIRPQKRNNGLQDLDTIQKVLETLKNPSSRKGLEYLANMTKKKPAIKLNGAQDHNEIPEEMQPRSPVEMSPQPQKKISANGLENRRNPNNPMPCILRPKTVNEPAMMEYPRQRQSARICYSMQAEKENGAVAINGNQQRCQPRDHAVSYTQDARSIIPYDRQNVPVAQGRHDDNVTTFQYANAPPQHYHQAQQYYLNGQNLAGHNFGQGDVASMRRPDAPGAMRIDRPGGDTGEKSNSEGTTKRVNPQGMNVYGQPEIRETRTIGGITYLARKPEYAPNNLVISPDKLIASRHLQPPRIF
ncbi:beta-hexosaminidase subunit beta [Lasius niger]|uniref:Beta-hexosaminidase subunit beta n=1 Tax=Lasius niger TaxID=67767 RepID=A0A0J7KW77_LASNI|nr:beta-hexosaminidase subunit beta [Lasius niger]